MKIADPSQNQLVNEVALMLAELPFAGASVLELGCGKAEKTRLLAETSGLRPSGRWKWMKFNTSEICNLSICPR